MPSQQRSKPSQLKYRSKYAFLTVKQIPPYEQQQSPYPLQPFRFVFEDNSLRQSLFGISEITNRDYDATFRKDGLSLYYQDGDLVHHTPKPPDATNWTLPLQRPYVHANAVLSLPSDKKYIRFMSASFGSPVLSTMKRALRKGYLSSLPRFIYICTTLQAPA